MSENSIEERIQILTALTEQLNDVLALERAALTDRDLAALTEATDNKVTVCKQIESATRDLGPLPLSEQLASLDAVDRAALEPLHKKLVAVSEKSREYNAVNGKIVHRSQQSVRELIKLMSGTDADLLYGESGQTLVKAKRTAIAKA
jgi:flagellar biosynthesis/type III secretory pathway chaperone